MGGLFGIIHTRREWRSSGEQRSRCESVGFAPGVPSQGPVSLLGTSFMHISGRILAWMVVLCGIGSLILASKAAQVRWKWMERAQKLEQELASNEKLLAEKQAKRDAIRSELRRVMIPWDRYWGRVPAAVADANSGQITLNLGSSQGLSDKQVVYAFAPQPDGSYFFVGNFQVSTLRDDRAALDPDWRVRPGEPATWQSGDWRIRTRVPAGFLTRFTELEVSLLVADTQLKSNLTELERQQQLVTLAENHLKLRQGEINGFDELQGKQLPSEMIKGLLTSLTEEEEERNEVLIQVDQLRHRLKQTNEQISQLRKMNASLVQTLPDVEESDPNATAAR